MSFYLFCLSFVATLLFCKIFLHIGNFKRTQEGHDTSNKAGLAVTASIILGWILLQASSSIFCFPFKNLTFGLYPFLIAAAALSMYSIRKGKVHRFWVYFFVTLISVMFIPEDTLVFNGIFPLFDDRYLTALLWAGFIAVYARMDKLNGATVIQTSTLSLAFSLFPLVTARAATYSVEFCYYPMIILAGLITFIHYKRYVPEASLGRTGSTPLGYLMGLFFVLLAIKGYWMAFIVMPTYYYFEFIYSSINKFIHRGMPEPEPTSFLFFTSWIVRRNLNVTGLSKFLFKVMLGFALIGVVLNSSIHAMLGFDLVLFLCTMYYMFYWGRAKVPYRTMFRDAKDAIQQVSGNVKDSVNTVSTYIKDKNKK
ncbi:MAG: hypothetical protein J6P93_00165 [Alphaproteobacteria bacterium]|nr:hypothetical protein [Alphaproteobacteria bacterium]